MSKKNSKKIRSNKKKNIITGFFAYPDVEKTHGEIIESAIQQFNEEKCNIKLFSWKNMGNQSSRIITNILEHINSCNYLLADLTGLNPNVLFEVGYALGKRRNLILTMQGYSQKKRNDDMEKIGILSTFNIHPFQNSYELTNIIKNNIRPDKTSAELDMFTVNWEQQANGALFLKGLTNHEIALEALKIFRIYFPQVKVDDWCEDNSQGLTWYLQEIARSMVVVSLFVDPSWDGAKEVNARFSFLSGLALSRGKDVKMIGLPGYKPAFDYRDILKRVNSVNSAKKIIEETFRDKYDTEKELIPESIIKEREEEKSVKNIETNKHDKEILILDILLGDIGNPVAELEEQELNDYFIRTAQYEEALKGNQTIIVGSKGTGKTANFFQLCTELSQNKKNIVCEIRPSDYKLSRFLNALKKVPDIHSGAVHIAENAWKLIGYCELVSAMFKRICARHISTGKTDSEEKFVAFCERKKDLINAPFEKKLEIISDWIKESDYNQDNFSEMVHREFISEATKLLRLIVEPYSKFFIVVDNLDKAWDKEQDLRIQGMIFFALLGLGRRIDYDLGKENKINLTVFIRRNIFEYILLQGRERDKLLSQAMEIVWKPNLLTSIIDKRVEVACERNNMPYINIWNDLYPKSIDGISTIDWIAKNVLPKPRDLIRFTQFAMESAFPFNAKNEFITEENMQEALKKYSAYAINQIITEYEEEFPWISPLVYSFSGTSRVTSLREVERHIKLLKLHEKYKTNPRKMVNQLIIVGFMGVKLNENDVRFALTIEDGIMLKEKITNHPFRKQLELVIHIAFQPHLGLLSEKERKKFWFKEIKETLRQSSASKAIET